MLTADDKKEIRSIVADEIEKQLKSSGKSHKRVVDIIKNSMEDLFKALWQKRSTWRHDVKG